MKIAFIIYNNMTLLDFAGVYDPLIRLKQMNFLPEMTWDICAKTEVVSDNANLKIIPTKINESLSNYDLIIVPGARIEFIHALMKEDAFLQWLSSAKDAKLITSVCTASLLLGATGLLKNEKATTHPAALEELKQYCNTVLNERIVHSHHFITAGGVTSSLDLGLYLCEFLTNKKAKNEIMKVMDYSSN